MSVVARRYYRRGCVALERGDVDAALESLRSALDLVASFVDARLAYAVALARIGDCPRAAQVLRAGLGREAGERARASLWATLGEVLTQAGDFTGAEDAFQQASATPGFAERADTGLARVWAKSGRYPEAFAALRRVARASRGLAASEAEQSS